MRLAYRTTLMSTVTARTISLPSGEVLPALGQGSWQVGAGRRSVREEIAALRLGLDLGMTLVDTAEMYGDGASERLIGRALAGHRDRAFVVSKVLPSHATSEGTIAACERSLRRLQTDRLDMYLLHWRGAIPLAETVAGFEALVEAGWIRHWGVSNFDLADMTELLAVPGGSAVECDQVLYNLARRGAECDLLPWCASIGLPAMAYSPLDQGGLAGDDVLARVAARHDATAAQVALAWIMRRDGVIAIPQASTRAHVRENHAALDLALTPDDLGELDRAMPRPDGPRPLEII